jgi:hypothetical protein
MNANSFAFGPQVDFVLPPAYPSPFVCLWLSDSRSENLSGDELMNNTNTGEGRVTCRLHFIA